MEYNLYLQFGRVPHLWQILLVNNPSCMQSGQDQNQSFRLCARKTSKLYHLVGKESRELNQDRLGGRVM